MTRKILSIASLTGLATSFASVAAFAADASLAARFPDSPAAHGKPCWSLVTYVKDRPGHDRRYAIDERKIREELGYKPAKTFESGFAETLSWFLENEAWWRALQSRAGVGERLGVKA